MSDRTCSVPDCEKTPRSGSAELCPMHYHRWYRHGSTDRVSTGSGITASNGRRYVTLNDRSHPLATLSGKVYEHRAVLFDAIGYGPHLCHWCGTPVNWYPKGHPAELQVDHLNNYGDDNRPENLVPSCRTCNASRGIQARADALRDAGWWSRHDTIATLRNGGRKPRVA